MLRRKFIHAVAGFAATPFAAGLARGGQAKAAQEVRDSAPAAGFNQYTEDYARFCATPAQDRVFYALHNGRIVSERLNNQTWQPTEWGHPPKLPVPGGSHDGVPMQSPIPGLAGDGPYRPS
jgi:alpha-L-fucosidase